MRLIHSQFRIYLIRLYHFNCVVNRKLNRLVSRKLYTRRLYNNSLAYCYKFSLESHKSPTRGRGKICCPQTLYKSGFQKPPFEGCVLLCCSSQGLARQVPQVRCDALLKVTTSLSSTRQDLHDNYCLKVTTSLSSTRQDLHDKYCVIL